MTPQDTKALADRLARYVELDIERAILNELVGFCLFHQVEEAYPDTGLSLDLMSSLSQRRW
jgi:hypothetical protein